MAIGATLRLVATGHAADFTGYAAGGLRAPLTESRNMTSAHRETGWCGRSARQSAARSGR